MSILAEDSTIDPISLQRREEKNRTALRWWLYLVLLVLFSLVVVGGATRLTESGLSITEWKPIHGVVPPLNGAEWQEEFEKYRQIPQYQQINKGMSLEEFKTIFWWEWAHRFLARALGVLFALPLAWFWFTGRIEKALKPRLLVLLALGGLQGAVGWWMVASGLVERTDVSQYRLATHLTLACVIFAAIMYVARGIAPHHADPASAQTRKAAGWLVALVLFQIYLGGLVAGLNAGYTFNTWPLMDSALIPSDLLIQSPWWVNFFENVKTVQFVHRTGAYLIFFVALWHMVAARRADPGSTHARRALLLFHLVLIQAIVGIATLLTHVQIHTALAHQAMALVVLAFAVAHWRGTKGPYPLETQIKLAR
ncbi:COX15/CtaA family protein [Limoniibacter endophyticus]|uniref:Heme A synthase n=1 Tax=Limoniibacter endophyticus TaxID=1565040 RepID=A0A8J3DJS9_9HYPH|nr:COX15/CtaA family protein [Limoniibacter endophyticus]GHC79131.1 heme A synthase [Limoniibacter endophyticus]